MSKALAALACATLLFSSVPVAVTGGSATIQDSGSSRYKSVRLTPAVYHAAAPDLADLRLYDATGAQLPYFIYSGGDSQQSATANHPLTQTDSYLKEDAFYLEFAAEAEPGVDLEATALQLTTTDKGPFAKELVLHGSYDGTHWQPVCTDTLFRVDGAEKLTVALPGVQSYTHYRLQLSGNQQTVAFDSAMLQYSAQTSQRYSLTETLLLTPTAQQQERQTELTLSGLRNLRLASLTLQTGDMFKRTVATPLGQQELYQLQFDDTAYRDTTLRLDGRAWTEDTLTITVRDGDDRPLKVDAVELEYLADELVFEGGTGPYRLEFGTGQPAPEYDIARYREQVLTQPIDRLALGEVAEALPAPQPPADSTDWQLIFNVVLVAVAALLGVLLLTRLRKPQSK